LIKKAHPKRADKFHLFKIKKIAKKSKKIKIRLDKLRFFIILNKKGEGRFFEKRVED